MDKHIAFDLDDVILDFTDGVRESVRREFGVEVPEFDDWNLAPILNPIVGENWWKWLRRRDWLWAGFPAIKGAVGVLEMLHREGYYLEIVTSKPEWARYAVWKWLGKWRLPVDRVSIVSTGESKVNHTTSPVLVDDKPENVQDYLKAGRSAILFRRSYNRGHSYWFKNDVNVKFAIVDDWQGVYKTVKEWTSE